MGIRMEEGLSLLSKAVSVSKNPTPIIKQEWAEVNAIEPLLLVILDSDLDRVPREATSSGVGLLVKGWRVLVQMQNKNLVVVQAPGVGHRVVEAEVVINRLDTDFTKMDGELAQMDIEVSQLVVFNEQLELDLAQVDLAITEIDAEVAQIAIANNQTTQQVAGITSAVTIIEQNVATNAGSVTALETTVGEIEIINNATNATVIGFQSDLVQAQTTATNASTSATQAKADALAALNRANTGVSDAADVKLTADAAKADLIIANNNIVTAQAAADQAKADLAALSVGGRNLLLSSVFPNDASLYTAWGGATVSASGGVVTAAPSASTTTTFGFRMNRLVSEGGTLMGGEHTLSFDYKSTTVPLMDYLYLLKDAGNFSIPNLATPANGQWSRVSLTFTVPDSSSAELMFATRTANLPANSSFSIRKPKLEKGNKATDWTPAPEDLQAAADAAQARADKAVADAAAVKIIADKAAADNLLRVGEIAAANARITTADGRITVALVNPTVANGSDKPVNALWQVKVGTQIDRSYVWTGTAWVQSTITQNFIGSNSIGSAQIINAAVGTLQVADAAITDAKIGTMSVGKLTANVGNFSAAVVQNLFAQQAFIDSVIAKKIIVQGGSNLVGTVLLENGAVTADKVFANSITTDKLLIGGATNLIPNGAINTGDINPWSNALTLSTDSPPGYTASLATPRGPTGTIINCQGDSWFDVVPGGQMYFEIWLKADKPNSVFYLELKDQDGAHVVMPGVTNPPDGALLPTTGTYLVGALTLPIVWTKYSVIFNVRSTSTRAKLGSLYPTHTAGTERTAIQYIAGVRLRPLTSGTMIESGTVTTDNIAANAITAAKIGAGQVTAGKLGALAVTAGTIAANAITAGTIDALAITTRELGALAVTADKIAALTITAAKIGAGQITAGKIGASAVVAGNVAANGIIAGNIAALAITTRELAAESVTAAKLVANAITARELSADAISGKTITGSLIRTAASGARTEVGFNALRTYDANNNLTSFVGPTGVYLYSNIDLNNPDAFSGRFISGGTGQDRIVRLLGPATAAYMDGSQLKFYRNDVTKINTVTLMAESWNSGLFSSLVLDGPVATLNGWNGATVTSFNGPVNIIARPINFSGANVGLGTATVVNIDGYLYINGKNIAAGNNRAKITLSYGGFAEMINGIVYLGGQSITSMTTTYKVIGTLHVSCWPADNLYFTATTQAGNNAMIFIGASDGNILGRVISGTDTNILLTIPGFVAKPS